MECNCSIYEHDICFDGVITHFSYDCLCCRNTLEEQEGGELTRCQAQFIK